VAQIVFHRADPREAKVRQLIEELDTYMARLYPSESNYGLDIASLLQPLVRFYAVTIDGEVLGCGGFWLHEDYAEVKRVYIHPKSRGLGLGRKIMTHLENEMLREGRRVARLETGISQPAALGLYRAIGYVDRGPFGDYPEGDPFCVFMEKQLAPSSA
jgi:putative acetyltransferase